MAYLLLLGLVASIGLIALLSPKITNPASRNSFIVGLVLISIGFLEQLVLGFALDENAARLFYWSRQMLALAWIGHGFLLFLLPNQSKTRWFTYGLIAASFLSLALVGGTQITKAESWFRPTIPIYAQITDLLATNRPTRWLAWLLNLYGGLSLIGGAIFLISKGKTKLLYFAPILAAAALLQPILLSPQESNYSFYVIELTVLVAIYWILAGDPANFRSRQRTARKKK